MIARLRALLIKVNGIPEHGLLWANVGLACFVALAHGGALAISLSKPTPNTEGIRHLAMFSLPIALIVITSAGLALVLPKWRGRVLGIHGYVFSASAVALLLWALNLLVNGLSQGNFTWSVGFLSAWVCYSVLLAGRFSVPPNLRTHEAVFYAPAAALLLSLPLDVGVFIRVARDISA